MTNSADFWLISITLSLLMGLLYSLCWQDLREGYGFRDIVNVWFTSLIIAVLGYAILLKARNRQLQYVYQAAKAKQKAEEEEWRKRTPMPGDNPITILEKLALQGLRTRLHRVRLFEDNGPIAFVLREDKAAATVVVAPEMEIVWEDDIDPELDGRIQEVRNKEDPAELTKLLKSGLGKVGMKWIQDNQLPGVMEVPQTQVKSTPNLGERRITG